MMRHKPDNFSGFTLVELMITVSIAAILMSMAIPSFVEIIASNRLTTRANELVTALNLARSEAIKRGIQVTVRRKGVTSGQWESGWDVFVDSDGDENPDNDADAILCGAGDGCLLLRTYGDLPSDYTLRTGGSTYKDYAAYLSSGLSTVVVGDTFRLCNGTDNTKSRAIAINSVGRPQVSTGTASCP